MGMILICLSLVLMVAGCGNDDGGGGDGGVDVVASSAIAADIAWRVAGPDARVESLLAESASPHDYGASAKDRARLEDADLVVAWGAGFEAGLPLDALDPPAFELAAGERDPHVWMDPTYVAEALPKLAGALAEADPAHADDYRARAAAFAERLVRLDSEVRRLLGAVPEHRRKLVTSHDSLGHFARRYDVEFVGAPFGLAPESEPSAAAVARLIERVKRERVPAIFAEETDDPELVEEIARETGTRLVDDLLVEGFGGRVDGYEEMLRFNARRIAEALAP